MYNLLPHPIPLWYQAGRSSGRFQAATLFVDISGFTALTETLLQFRKGGAEALADALSIIFTPPIQEVYRRGGFIPLFAGDAFTAIFPGGDFDDDRALSPTAVAAEAVQTALFIQQFLKQQGADRRVTTPYGEFSIGAKVGLSFGDVSWGIPGIEAQRVFYFRGPAVDGCARAEQMAATGEIIADPAIWPLIAGQVTAVALPAPGYYQLTADAAEPTEPLTSAVRPSLTLADLQPFIPLVMLNLSIPAEFREVCSVFISFAEPEDKATLHAFINEVLTAVRQFGGAFSQVDFGDKGGLIVILFGAPLAHENDVERAAECLLALHGRELKLPWRAGLSFGVAWTGLRGSRERYEYQAIGDVVNLAARLALQAPWGELWTGDAVYHLLQNNYRLEPLGDFQFKGKSRRLPVYRLDGLKQAATAAYYTGRLIGRDNELAWLRQMVAPIHNGRFAGVIYVDGEPGAGKSRLIHELLHQERETVAWFYCPADEIRRQSLNPFKQFLRQQFEQTGEQQNTTANQAAFDAILNALVNRLPADDPGAQHIRQELLRTRSILAALVDLRWPDSLYEQLDPRLRFENSLHAFRNFIKANALLQPVIIYLEDAHWFDDDSHKLLQVLVRQMDAYPLAIIAAGRYHDDGRAYRFELDPTVPQPALNLLDLSTDSVRQVAEQVLQAAVSDETVAFLAEKTNGNPFFVEQLILDLRERQLLVHLTGDDGRALYALPTAEHLETLPSNINAVLTARLDRLTTNVKQVVQTAAVLGREFELPVLAEMLRADERLPDKVRQAEREQIWAAMSESRYLFRHALLRDAAYEMQLQTRLRELHQLAAMAIEQLHSDRSPYYGDLAYQWQRAGHTDNEGRYAALTGEQAAARYANDEAVRYLQRALELAQSPHKQVVLMLKLGEVKQLTGKWAETEELYRRALDLAQTVSDLSAQTRCQNLLGSLCLEQGLYNDALAWLEQAQLGWRLLNDSQGLGITIGRIGSVHWNLGDHVRALTCFEEYRQLSAAGNDRQGLSRALAGMGLVQWQTGHLQEALDCYRQNLEIDTALNDRPGVGKTIGNMGIIHWYLGDYAQALACFSQQWQIAGEAGDRRVVGIALGNMGEAYRYQGGYEQALLCYGQSLQIALELRNQRSMTLMTGYIAMTYAGQGDYEAARPLLERAIEQARALRILYYLCDYLHQKAALVWRLEGAAADAHTLNNEAVAIAGQIKRREIHFAGQLLAIRLAVALTEMDLTEASVSLAQLLDEAADAKEQAAVYYTRWRLDRNEQDWATAVSLYRQCHAQTPNVEYRHRYRELTGESLPPPRLPDLPAPIASAPVDLPALLAN